MRNIAVIPARSGSKGLKDKNIKILKGKPLMAYTIEAARKSNLFNEIFVSTDSVEYGAIAREFGASVPFLRSEELSSDNASSWDVVKDALLTYKKLGKEFDTVALLQPTSPLRNSDDIVNAYDQMKNKNANAVVAVCEVDHPPLWCNTLPEDDSMVNFIRKDIRNRPRQQLDTYYRINGALYIAKVPIVLGKKDIYETKSFAYKMDRKRSIDIDNELDFKIAQMIMKYVSVS